MKHTEIINRINAFKIICLNSSFLIIVFVPGKKHFFFGENNLDRKVNTTGDFKRDIKKQ